MKINYCVTWNRTLPKSAESPKLWFLEMSKNLSITLTEVWTPLPFLQWLSTSSSKETCQCQCFPFSSGSGTHGRQKERLAGLKIIKSEAKWLTVLLLIIERKSVQIPSWVFSFLGTGLRKDALFSILSSNPVSACTVLWISVLWWWCENLNGTELGVGKKLPSFWFPW